MSTAEPRYFNRELSWLAFNRRVLEEAQDGSKPLVERAKFLAIVGSNLDEFTMVRYAELRAFAKGLEQPDRYLGDPKEDLAAVRAAMHALVDDQYRCWREGVAPALVAAGAVVIPPGEWTETERESLRRFYVDKIEPVLTPLAVDPARRSRCWPTAASTSRCSWCRSAAAARVMRWSRCRSATAWSP